MRYLVWCISCVLQCIIWCALYVSVGGLECHCNVCGDEITNCTLKPNSKCFTAVELMPDGQESWTFGCFPPEEGTIMQVLTLHKRATIHQVTTKKCPISRS